MLNERASDDAMLNERASNDATLNEGASDDALLNEVLDGALDGHGLVPRAPWVVRSQRGQDEPASG